MATRLATDSDGHTVMANRFALHSINRQACGAWFPKLHAGRLRRPIGFWFRENHCALGRHLRCPS
ncbi:protein of unknown function [Cupriavidus neocaledonicus]|uniref:Uncharacterized protein n=1 Tax=Cupriavidus neocaledonicus TaxID=1040979 RepID=A0A375H2Y8_9BURK|nr:hypothetical protein CBM2605_A80201 [Cupriavidus neocaledonicus]SPD46291.1 protein of unknown function [Cupriavidus neocaledonicus]